MKLFILANDTARQNAAKACMDPQYEGWEMRLREPSRNLSQNALLHSILTEISNERKWADRIWDVESWKRLLCGAWCRANGLPATFAPAIDGVGVEVLYRRTSDLTKAECASLIDYIVAWKNGGDV
jgi:hypothetical protein